MARTPKNTARKRRPLSKLTNRNINTLTLVPARATKKLVEYSNCQAESTSSADAVSPSGGSEPHEVGNASGQDVQFSRTDGVEGTIHAPDHLTNFYASDKIPSNCASFEKEITPCYPSPSLCVPGRSNGPDLDQGHKLIQETGDDEQPSADQDHWNREPSAGSISMSPAFGVSNSGKTDGISDCHFSKENSDMHTYSYQADLEAENANLTVDQYFARVTAIDCQ